MGHVGLPTAVSLALGHEFVATDIDRTKIADWWRAIPLL
jgi:UDP-glucose 6-dehydrogenase